MWERGLKHPIPQHHCREGMSLPMWERGLKRFGALLVGTEGMSLPMWERGLKHQSVRHWHPSSWSLPMWERGLKLADKRNKQNLARVAPHVGAWIETQMTDKLMTKTMASRSPCGSVD